MKLNSIINYKIYTLPYLYDYCLEIVRKQIRGAENSVPPG